MYQWLDPGAIVSILYKKITNPLHMLDIRHDDNALRCGADSREEHSVRIRQRYIHRSVDVAANCSDMSGKCIL